MKCFLIFCPNGSDLYLIYMTSNSEMTTHQPGIKLTQVERQTKSRVHKFGLCEYCDVGLDKSSDFICHTPTNRGFKFMCNSCHEYYNPGRVPDTINFEF